MTRVYAPLPPCPKDLPAHFYATLKLYLEHGCQPGQFLTAVLCNDLSQAVAHADDEAMAALQRIVQFVYNDMPSPCWGNLDKVRAWMREEHKNYHVVNAAN
jgi:hypothetical protein